MVALARCLNANYILCITFCIREEFCHTRIYGNCHGLDEGILLIIQVSFLGFFYFFCVCLFCIINTFSIVPYETSKVTLNVNIAVLKTLKIK